MKLVLPLLLILLTGCSPKPLVKQDDNTQKYNKKKLVQHFIQIIENNDAIQLSKHTIYPLKRRHPLTNLVDDVAIVDRFNEIFDEEFKALIIKSDPLKDWSDVGSKGIMFSSGLLWLDFNGRLTAVNYQSAAEKQKISELLMKQNSKMHESVRIYEKPVFEMTTASYKIRVDDLGDYNYRYASWAKDKSLLEAPDLILEKGKKVNEGNAGSHSIFFTNEAYSYELQVIKMGPNDGPLARLIVHKGQQKLLAEDAIRFKD